MSTTLTVDFFMSLDGYGSAEGWPGYWGKEGPELRQDRVRHLQPGPGAGPRRDDLQRSSRSS